MSINVTVSGNPVSIKRGKMVTIDSNSSKEEFDKRRLLRLEQVRQQSKDIAGNVRNKVREEKLKQMKKIEEKGKEKLNDWKNRKLLELQSQYKEALKELGTGHKEAQKIEEEFQDFEAEKMLQRQLSVQRGREASTKLQNDKIQENLQKSSTLQKKQIVRDVEKTRANLVSHMKNMDNIHKKKKGKSKANISISIPDSVSESDQSTVNDSENIYPHDIEMSCQEYTERLEHQQKPFKASENIENISKTPQSCESHKGSLKSEVISEIQNLHFDTRISDRIKRRELQISQPDYCDNIIENGSTPYVVSNTKIREAIDSHLDKFRSDKIPLTETCKCCLYCGRFQDTVCVQERKSPHKVCSCSQERNIYTNVPPNRLQQNTEEITKLEINKSDNLETKPEVSQRYTEIPVKPPVRLKDVPSEGIGLTQKSKNFNKVQYYDHSNRFLVERDVPSNSYVEKNTTESAEIIPNGLSEKQMKDEIKRRDKEVQMRGKKALATERIKRDYEDMLKKLPLLQKKEKILELQKDKPEYHMNEDRLKEVERIRKNKLENAFNKMFPNLKPAVVTLPKINKGLEQTIQENMIDESIHSLDLNQLDAQDEEPKVFSEKEVQEIVRAFTQQKPADRRAKLKELLKRLKLQKDELIKEIKAMPQSQDESINDLINDLNSFDNDQLSSESKRKKDTEKLNRKRRHTENDLLSESTESNSSSVDEKQRTKRTTKVRLKSTPTRKKKSRSKAKVIILQNNSTQTTPVNLKQQISNVQQNVEKEKTKVLTEDSQPKNICKKLHIPCECKDTENPEELCRILINLDDNKPAVTVETGNYVQENETKEKVKRIESKSVGVETDQIMEKPVKDATRKTRDISERKQVIGKSLGELGHIKKNKHVHRNSVEKPVKTSWRDQLTKNSISTSSTSYMSPPDVNKSKSVGTTSSKNKKSFYNLHGKPQQKNISSTLISSINKSDFDILEKINPQLIAYVEKLLGMSRASIENLNISATSTVTTPSQSLIELESNNPNSHLQEVIKGFSTKIGKIAEELSYSPDKSPLHFNTSVSASEDFPKAGDEGVNKDEVDKSKSKETILQQYAELTDSCSKRIASLASMIQQIRQEKIEMFQNPLILDEQVKSPICSDKEFSTAYMDLPEFKETKRNKQLSSSSSSSLSTDEEEILKKLLEVDLSLAKKLSKLEPEKSDKHKDTVDTDTTNHLTAEFEKRLEGLLQSEPLPLNEIVTKPTLSEKEQPFLAFLSDIQKLPKFEAEVTNEPFNNHKRPPPSKGLSIVKKFNENISLVPHELSTIIEADSQVSTKLGNGLPSPPASKSSLSLSPLKDVELIILPKTFNEPINKPSPKIANTVIETKPVNISHSSNHSSQNPKSKVDSSIASSSYSNSGVCELSCSKTSRSVGESSKQNSTSSDDIETIEAMLRSIGMEWAIPTLHKTKEALALSSSTSSLDLSLKNKVYCNDSVGRNVNLKALLSNHLHNKISSSTSISDTSPVSILGNISDFSAFQVNSKDRQRTSTPLTTSKNTSKSKDCAVFSMESDISSVNNATS